MHEYDVIYERWKRWRWRKRRKLLVALLLPLAGGAYLLYSQYNTKLAHYLPQPTSHAPKEQKEQPAAATKTKKNFRPQMVLPDLDFERKLATVAKSVKEQEPSTPKKELEETTPKPTPPKTPAPQEEPPQVKLQIQTEQADIDRLLKRFQSAPSAPTAVLIARYYYDRHNYKEAAQWAIKANELDKTNEASWLIFARSMAKMGKRAKAIEILRLYIKQFNSKKAKILLREIEKGTF